MEFLYYHLFEWLDAIVLSQKSRHLLGGNAKVNQRSLSIFSSPKTQTHNGRNG